ncbi:F0F1 ATP synthase subunit B [Candidatus Peregrinibacteria bacterium]|nr:F0F1 ATP synthase subunit B [Candidatus Peregrinibacteria bacterium]
MELLQKLGIDWKLLLAQIINFTILLTVLYLVAYKPILELLEKRTKTIEKGIRDAKESEEKMQRIAALQEEKLSEAQKQVGKMLEEAKRDAESVKKEIMAHAAAESEDMLRRTRLQMVEEKEKMISEVKKEVTKFIVLATSKILEREFSTADQQRLTDAISKEIKTV